MNQHTGPNDRQVPENALSGLQERLKGDCGQREAPERENGAQEGVQGSQSTEPARDAGPSVREWAWCFSHGRQHRFTSDQKPWCTATWTWLDGATEADALAHKSATYGDAQFLHQLPAEQQLQLIQNRR